MQNPRITLEQWAAFKAVIDEGSYARAAEALDKSQSSISYALAGLNEQLPQPVLKMEGRRAVLTQEGKVMYRRASELLRHARETEEFSRMLAQGIEAEVRLALDAVVDLRMIIPALSAVADKYPQTRIRILETALSGTEEALLEQQAELVIGGYVPVGYNGTPLRPLRMIPVAHPDHPLFHRDIAALHRSCAEAGVVPDPLTDPEAIHDWELKAHRQIVHRDTGQRREQDVGWLGSEQRWTVSHFSSSLKVLYSGLAFAFMPVDWVEDDLRTGRLKQLPLLGGGERLGHLYLMHSTSGSAGPVTRLLARELTDCLAVRAAPQKPRAAVSTQQHPA